MFLVVLLQVMVLNHVNLWGYAVPLLGVMVLFHVPLNAGRIGNMFMAFFTGLVLDAFSNSPGVAAGAMTLAAFVQYPLLHAMAPKDAVEDALPGIGLMGKYTYFAYIAILRAVHHVVYFTFGPARAPIPDCRIGASAGGLGGCSARFGVRR